MPSIALPVSLRGQLLSGVRSAVAVFNPIDLFATGSQGIWLDPSDLSTMFSDRAGTTAVTAPGTVVGLRLDKSKGLVLGSELVTNGDFSGGSTDWTTEAVWTIGSGVATYTSGGAGNSLRQFFSMAAGKSYRVTFNVVAQTGSAAVQATANGIETSGSITTTGAKTCILTPTATRSQILFYASGTGILSIDNISVRELAGNHAVAPTDAARPIYGVEPKGGRRNLLTWSEDFGNAAWTKANTNITPNADIAPDGTVTAEKIFGTAGATSPSAAFTALGFTNGVAYTYTLYAKADGYNFLLMSLSDIGFPTSSRVAVFNLSTGNVGTATQSGLTATMQPVGSSGWYRCRLTQTADETTASSGFAALGPRPADEISGTAANGTSGVLIWGAQLELGSTATNYQRVTTAYDVTESGVATCHYVQYDGSDDSMSTSAIDFTATDKMSVFAGVRKNIAQDAVVAELSSDFSANNGTFILSSGTSIGHYFGLRGTTVAAYNSTFVAPQSSVQTVVYDIAGAGLADEVKPRINGAVPSLTANSFATGTGNFGNHSLFIGRRNNATLPFSGKDYGIIVVGKAATTTEITGTETWLAARTAQVTL